MSASRPGPEATVSVGLVLTLAVQSAVPPFATDMYTPAFPEVSTDLATSATAVGLTLTAFFIGMGLGQVLGGSASDHRGRRLPMIAGGLTCSAGAVMCALAPSITVLMVGRLLQGIGGGAAAVVARAVVVDIARGDQLARLLSVLMAIGGLAPMLAPVAGGAVLQVGTWRTVFWCLVGIGLLMTVLAVAVVPETLPPERRGAGGLRRLAAGMGRIVTHRRYMGYVLTSASSAFAMFAYVSSSSFVLQEIKGLSAQEFSVFFAGTAGSQLLLSLLNANLVGRARPRRLIGVGLSVSAVGVIIVVVSVFALDVALVPLCVGFLLLMSAQAFVFGNASALALGEVRHLAGQASALMGVVQAIAMGTSAPLASSGGGSSAVPMAVVMVVGVVAAWSAYLLVGRVAQERHLPNP